MDHERASSSRQTLSLEAHLPGFASWLEEHAYKKSTVEQYSVIATRFAAYLAREGIDVADLEDRHVDAFAAHVEPRRKGGRREAVAYYYRLAIRRLLQYLRERGAITPAPIVEPQDPTLVCDYLTFLRDHRGIVEQTIQGQRVHLRRFLSHAGLDGEADELRTLSVTQIDAFLIDATRDLKRTSLNHVCGALRGFLRFLHMREVLAVDLSEQVTTPKRYSLEALPRAIPWADVERTLAAVDRTSVKGRRNYAILALLAYCGLRASEVALLRLDDLDWRHDTIHVRRSKSHEVDALPLLPAAGNPLIDYLRCRPASARPEVFLKVLAPAGPMSRANITFVARKYLLAAGVEAPHLGAHTLRHSHAVELLRQGFPLKTIGDVLGHQNPQSTFIYTKVAVEDLRSVALEVTEVQP